MPVSSQAHPVYVEGGQTGVLLLHGFTGSPASLRPWAEYLAGQGHTVLVPRLPGHGTSVAEMNRTRWQDWFSEASHALDRLTHRCAEVYVAGLSMGGALALRLAAERDQDVTGLVLVNPIVIKTDKRLLATPVLKRLIGSVSGITNDIKKPGVDEFGYARVPLRALDSLRELMTVVRGDLPRVTAPLLLFRSVEDHVVEPLSSELVLQRVSSRDVTERVLDNSYHVATLDNDAPGIFAESAEFIAKTSRLADDDAAF